MRGGVHEVVLLPAFIPHQSFEAQDPLVLFLKVPHLLALVVHHGPDICQTSRVIRTCILSIEIEILRKLFSNIFLIFYTCLSSTCLSWLSFFSLLSPPFLPPFLSPGFPPPHSPPRVSLYSPQQRIVGQSPLTALLAAAWDKKFGIKKCLFPSSTFSYRKRNRPEGPEKL